MTPVELSIVLPLDDLVVVDLSCGIPGAYCTKVLADAGADVVKVEARSGDPLRRWSAGGASIAPDDDGALFQFLAGGSGAWCSTWRARPTSRTRTSSCADPTR